MEHFYFLRWLYLVYFLSWWFLSGILEIPKLHTFAALSRSTNPCGKASLCNNQSSQNYLMWANGSHLWVQRTNVTQALINSFTLEGQTQTAAAAVTAGSKVSGIVPDVAQTSITVNNTDTNGRNDLFWGISLWLNFYKCYGLSAI